tara:strand:- start:5187 stop:5534 length:348 start_codon:yes stop_codon:yes gene_type:complete
MNTFHEANKNSKEQKIALVDIDETICFYSGKRKYNLSEPNFKNIAKINKLYDNGWKIIYWTARGSVSGIDYREHTLKQLKDWGCKFNELTMGTGFNPKPMFDLVIDDKAKRIEEI